MLLNKGIYKHQYYLSLHSSPDPNKIIFHFQESQLISPHIKIPFFTQTKNQNNEPKTQKPKINLKKFHSKIPSQVQPTPTSPFTFIKRTNNLSPIDFDNSNIKTVRYEQFQHNKYLVNKYLAPRKLGLHKGTNLLNSGIINDTFHYPLFGKSINSPSPLQS